MDGRLLTKLSSPFPNAPHEPRPGTGSGDPPNGDGKQGRTKRRRKFCFEEVYATEYFPKLDVPVSFHSGSSVLSLPSAN